MSNGNIGCNVCTYIGLVQWSAVPQQSSNRSVSVLMRAQTSYSEPLGVSNAENQGVLSVGAADITWSWWWWCHLVETEHHAARAPMPARRSDIKHNFLRQCDFNCHTDSDSTVDGRMYVDMYICIRVCTQTSKAAHHVLTTE